MKRSSKTAKVKCYKL